MSVYGGFATRIQETAYNRAVYNMLCLLQLKVAKSLQGESFNDLALSKYFTKFYRKICILDESKHMSPLFSHSLKDLAGHFKLSKETFTGEICSLSSTSSDFSFHNLYVSGLPHGSPLEQTMQRPLTSYVMSKPSPQKTSQPRQSLKTSEGKKREPSPEKRILRIRKRNLILATKIMCIGKNGQQSRGSNINTSMNTRRKCTDLQSIYVGGGHLTKFDSRAKSTKAQSGRIVLEKTEGKDLALIKRKKKVKAANFSFDTGQTVKVFSQATTKKPLEPITSINGSEAPSMQGTIERIDEKPPVRNLMAKHSRGQKRGSSQLKNAVSFI